MRTVWRACFGLLVAVVCVLSFAAAPSALARDFLSADSPADDLAAMVISREEVVGARAAMLLDLGWADRLRVASSVDSRGVALWELDEGRSWINSGDVGVEAVIDGQETVVPPRSLVLIGDAAGSSGMQACFVSCGRGQCAACTVTWIDERPGCVVGCVPRRAGVDCPSFCIVFYEPGLASIGPAG